MLEKENERKEEADQQQAGWTQLMVRRPLRTDVMEEIHPIRLLRVNHDLMAHNPSILFIY